jgi:hypothetical protein
MRCSHLSDALSVVQGLVRRKTNPQRTKGICTLRHAQPSHQPVDPGLEHRKPHQPNAMSSEEVAVILSEAIARPTPGPKSLLRHLKARREDRSASGVGKVLRRHHLGTARQRIAALASLTAAETGQLTEHALEGPSGFCLFAAAPGEVVAPADRSLTTQPTERSRHADPTHRPVLRKP